MVRDMYIRPPSDEKYIFGEYEFVDPIESIITKIKMILGTIQGQVLGDLNFGIGLEELVFETRLNKFDLEERITAQIYAYISEAAEYSIKPRVQFGKTTNGSDYALIDIFINDAKAAGVLVN